MQHNQPAPILTLRIFWGALLGSQFIYAFVLNFLLTQNDNPPDSVNSMLVPVFASMSVLLIFAAILLQRILLKEAKKQLLAKHGAVDLSRLNISELITQFTSPFIIRLALFEAIALFGFALGFLNKDLKYFFPFVGVSMVAFFLNFPTEEKVKEAFKNL